MKQFVHDATGSRVVFGAGAIVGVRDELAGLGSRPLMLVDDMIVQTAGPILPTIRELSVAVIDRVRQHVPLADADAARSVARDSDADCIAVLGGGSAIGLAKAIALTEGLPILAVPTTYAGSEMTPIWGLTEGGVKTTGRHPVVAPRVIIYDPELTVTLPSHLTATSGLNALAHCIDALWAPGASPLTDVMAARGIQALAESLELAVHHGSDLDARARVLVGAWLAGATFGIAGSSVHHKLCHALGGRFDLPHADTHAALLPWSVRLATARLPESALTICQALDAEDAFEGVRDLESRLGVMTTLADLGLSRSDLQPLVDQLDLDKLAFPVPLERRELDELMDGAVSGL